MPGGKDYSWGVNIMSLILITKIIQLYFQQMRNYGYYIDKKIQKKKKFKNS